MCLNYLNLSNLIIIDFMFIIVNKIDYQYSICKSNLKKQKNDLKNHFQKISVLGHGCRGA